MNLAGLLGAWVVIVLIPLMFVLCALFKPFMKLVRKLLPKQGEGPSPEKLAKGHFKFFFVAHGDNAAGSVLRGTVSAQKDVGYGGTAIMAVESALCLAKDALDTKGGVLTTATALGAPLLDRLNAAGINFKVDTDQK